MPGTGILDDYRITPRALPLDLVRWCLAARILGVKVAFVSVGAGPISNPTSRWLMKVALHCSSYRSFRDSVSLDYARELGCATAGDRVFPDLAFALPGPEPVDVGGDLRGGLTVGVGVMTYLGWRLGGEREREVYQAYVDRMSKLIMWLREEGYRVRLLSGEDQDRRAVEDILALVRDRRIRCSDETLAARRICSWADLVWEVTRVDFVIASRFHNLVCAMLCGKPAISLGYASKNDALLREFGLSEFCQHIDDFDFNLVKKQVVRLVHERDAHVKRIRQQVVRIRAELREQADLLFGCGVRRCSDLATNR